MGRRWGIIDGKADGIKEENSMSIDGRFQESEQHSPEEAAVQNGIRLDAEIGTRRGVYADNVMARTIGNNTVLDFINVDVVGDSPESSGAVLAARIYMPNEAIVALREMLNAHTSAWTVQNAGTTH